MRKLAIVVALSSTVLATPALARNGAWYVGGDFGGMIVEDIGFDFGQGPTVPSGCVPKSSTSSGKASNPQTSNKNDASKSGSTYTFQPGTYYGGLTLNDTSVTYVFTAGI